MISESAHFVDEFLNRHQRGAELGRGGQGAVFRTKDPDIAVKIALDGNGMPLNYEDYARKLRKIRSLPIPLNLNLALPLAVLNEHAGYVMRLLQDMEPFSTFWLDPSQHLDQKEIPQWLSSLSKEAACELIHYRDTGGLRRRLMALYKCAATLARIHGAGLVYGDVSPSHAFISQNHGSREVWLIDADNLRFETREGGPGIFTPQFGAPELVRGVDGARQRTDAHAFAVMAFSMLTMLHPFIGAFVEAGNGRDWADDGPGDPDLDELAHAGQVPWIFDQEDSSNRKDNGLPGLLLTQELQDLFQCAFGLGRTKPWLRPSMFAWPIAFARALDETIVCTDCAMSYPQETEEGSQACPFCQAVQQTTLIATSYDWCGRPLAKETPTWRFVMTWNPSLGSATLPNRVFQPFSIAGGDRDTLRLTLDQGDLRLTICEPSRGWHFAFAHEDRGFSGFLGFEGTAALPFAKARKGLWLRIEGPTTRIIHLRVGGDLP